MIYLQVLLVLVFRGLLSIISLLSPLWAGMLSRDNSGVKMFLGASITINILCVANVNTILFNDITSSWLAFATFLIWNIKFNEEPEDGNDMGKFTPNFSNTA